MELRLEAASLLEKEQGWQDIYHALNTTTQALHNLRENYLHNTISGCEAWDADGDAAYESAIKVIAAITEGFPSPPTTGEGE